MIWGICYNGWMKNKLYIFDLDGTILNSLKDLSASLNHSLKWNHYPEKTEDEVQAMVGNGIYVLCQKSIEDISRRKEDIDKVYSVMKQHYFNHCTDASEPYEGIIPLLKKLKQNGVFTAVCSNKSDEIVSIICNHYFKDLFDMTMGETEGIAKKPAPDSIFHICNTLHTEISEAVYIGDSEVDIQTIKNAAMQGILVSWGFRNPEFLRTQGAKNLVFNPLEILNY